ncbi:MAG: hypothetical protein Q8P95_00450 [bacterium]|nr:hypothetical protein [bacterium]
MYQTLEERIESVLSFLEARSFQRAVLRYCYLNPSVLLSTLEKDFSVQANGRDLQSMITEGLLKLGESGAEVQVFPIPLSLLANRSHPELFSKDTSIQLLSEINQWITYPVMRSPQTKYKMATGALGIQWLFEAILLEWERVYCWGDYESFIENLGFEVERDWIQERIKKGKKASVLATQDGQYAQEIFRKSKQELRDCLIKPSDFSQLFIMSFPESKTTVMGNKNGELTFVLSSEISDHYAQSVRKGLQLR